MTRLTEQYLRNYLEKKALTMAADQEVKEAASLVWHTRAIANLIPHELLQERVRRQQNAVAMQQVIRSEEAAAYDVYMEHLRSER
jgi:hypothetical protein